MIFLIFFGIIFVEDEEKEIKNVKNNIYKTLVKKNVSATLFSLFHILYFTISLQILNQHIHFMHLSRYIDGLGAMGRALAATDAVAGLAQTRHTTVVTYQESTALLLVVRVLLVIGQKAFLDALVVVREDSGDVDTVWAGHAVVALVAWDGLEVEDIVSDSHQQVVLFLCDGFQGGIGAYVLLEMLHIGHTA